MDPIIEEDINETPETISSAPTEMYEWRNAVFNRYGTIDMEINHPTYGWIPFTADPNDTEGYGAALFAAAEPTAAPYVPPNIEEQRASWAPLARSKFKLALSKKGLKTANVQALIDDIEDPDEMDEAQIIWDDEQTFSRLMPFVVNVIGAAKTPLEIDEIWQLGLTL